jgi:hypothetical protein
MKNTQERSTTSPALQAAQGEFEAMREDYLEQQQGFLEATQETARLRATAKALLAEASEANAAWKDMAKERKADQRKINAQIEQAVKLKQQAEGLSTTADVREELHQSLVLSLAESRYRLSDKAGEVNSLFRAERLAELVATPGLKEALSEIYALCRYSVNAGLSGLDRGSFRSESDLEDAHMREFCRAIGLKRIQGAPALVAVPGPVTGEVVAEGLLALKRLRDAGGAVPMEPIQPRASASRPAQGLRQA